MDVIDQLKYRVDKPGYRVTQKQELYRSAHREHNHRPNNSGNTDTGKAQNRRHRGLTHTSGAAQHQITNCV